MSSAASADGGGGRNSGDPCGAKLTDQPKSKVHQVLREWNDHQVSLPADLCVRELIEQQARRIPDAVAVGMPGEDRAGSRFLTYGALDQYANGLARTLSRLGAEPEVGVGVCLGRSLETVITLVAVFKSGGVYVPLDPADPPRRMAVILDNVRPAVVVTMSHQAEQFGWDAAVGGTDSTDEGAVRSEGRPRVLRLDDASYVTMPSRIPGGDDGVQARCRPENLAYVIHTSGSSGRPKGVMVSHRSLRNLINWSAKSLALTSGDQVLQFASTGFDASLEQLCTGLTCGATLVLRSADMASTAASFMAVCREWRLAAVDLPTAFWHELLLGIEAESMTFPESLRQVVIGGEKALPAMLEGWDRWVGGRVRLLNTYGPTEATVMATAADLTTEAEQRAVSEVPIGAGIDNLQAYVLDGALQPVPPGVVGELCLSGVGLARGYLAGRRNSATSFVPDPFATDIGGGSRLYRTGDLVLFDTSGQLFFEGRWDQQVKIRGFRVELGEIESALVGHECVGQSVVVSRELEGGGRSLAAYVVTSPRAHRIEPVELRSYLEARLPSYLVPAEFNVVESLPLTPNGKVDRRALAKLQPNFQTNFVAPATATEAIVATLWADVLSRDRVSANDHFFHLGGHSLLATRVLARANRTFGVDLRLSALFDSPTVAAFSARIDQSSQVGDHEFVSASADLRSDDSRESSRVSYAQRRMWFLHRLAPTVPIYNEALAFEMSGVLDVAILDAGLTEIQRRHQVLRASFPAVDGVPILVIRDLSQPVLPIIDLVGVATTGSIQNFLRTEARRAFDLESGPVMRTLLLRLSAERHVLLVVWHHIVIDEWSADVWVDELCALYRALLSEQPSPLIEPEIQYSDFAAWQHHQSGGFEQHLDFWRRQLAGASDVLELPTDRPRPAIRDYRGKQLWWRWPTSLRIELEAISKAAKSSLFMTSMAAFQLLLTRLTGQIDVSLGTPIANRPRAQTEKLIGLFLNTLVIRTDLSGNPTFLELLGRVREVALAAYSHQDLPFDLLVEAITPERSASADPLFQVMFAEGESAHERFELPEVVCRPVMVDLGTAKFDLTLWLAVIDGEIQGKLEYSEALFDLSTVKRLIGHLERLLHSVVADPSRPIETLELLSSSELHQVLHEWSVSGRQASAPEDIMRRWSRQAAARRDALAVTYGQKSLSYGELDHRAQRLAGELRGRGIGRDQVIAVFSERSFELVIAVLGILKTGAAYLSLDPEYPPDRLELMLTDARVDLVLAQESLAHKAPAGTLSVLVLAPGGRAMTDSQSLGAKGIPGPGGSPGLEGLAVATQDLAYIVYTSGSAGRPKGVAMTRGAVANLVGWQMTRDPIAPEAVLQFASPSFDVFCQELFSTWCGGGRLVLLDGSTRRDPRLLWRVIADQRIQWLFLSPVALQQVAEAWDESLREVLAVRRIFAAGEQLRSTPAIRRLMNGLDSCALENQYGPSESHVVSASSQSGDVACWPDLPAIGWPIEGARLRLLNRALQSVPIGVAGELFIGGCAIARGYLRRGAWNAEKFIPDPWGVGDRLYRSGDLTRHLADGRLEFLGRIDRQLKIKGFRVEPNEIEGVLTRHSAVRQAVVVAPDSVLIACFVADRPIATSELRDLVGVSLPDYMIPARFVQLDALPLTPSGKLDRRMLSSAGWLANPAAAPWSQPRSEIEALVAGVWSDVLGIVDVASDDSFFALGGHSMSGARVVLRLENLFGIDLGIKVIFDAPTVATLAARIEELKRHSRSAAFPALERLPRSVGDVPLSFAQRRMWFLDQLDPGSSQYNLIPVAVSLRGTLSLDALTSSLSSILQRHAVLRTRFPIRDGEPLQHIESLMDLPFSTVDLAHLVDGHRELESARYLQEAADRPFDLASGPVWRVQLLRKAADEHLLIVTLHHIVGDGWSLAILRREFTTLYRAAVTGQPSPLEPIPIRYVDFAEWQRRWLTQELQSDQLAYWRRQLDGAPSSLQLPTDRPRSSATRASGHELTRTILVDSLTDLASLGRGVNATLFMTLLGIFQVLLGRWTHQREVLVGTPIGSRTQPELEGLFGLFVNTVVIRTELVDPEPSTEMSFLQLLDRLRTTVLAAYEHQEVPFDQVVEALAPARGRGEAPFAQALFGFEYAPLPALDLYELESRSVAAAPKTAKVDMTLIATAVENGLRATLEYRTELFDAVTMERFLGHFDRLVRSVLGDPNKPIMDLDLLTRGERQQLLVEFNESTPSTGDGVAIPEMFAAQVRCRPSAIAVAYGDDVLSYGELDRRAGQVARELLSLGLGPEDVVATFIDRSPEMVISLLAILNAGGAYLPLDVTDPQRRLRHLLADAGVKLLLTRQGLIAQVPQGWMTKESHRVLVIDQESASRSSIGPASRARVGREWTTAGKATCLARLAYVIYTSGSTGEPKGVGVSHRGVIRLVADTNYVNLGPGSRIAQASNNAFDAATFEIWGALLNGGRLIGLSRETLLSSQSLKAELQRQRIDDLFLTTALMNQVVSDEPDAFESVGTLLFGGETANPERVRRLLNHGSPRKLLHVYGPTENTTFSTCMSVDSVLPNDLVVPIGQPITGTTTYVLDQQLHPVPAGVSGEIFLGGAGLARGYLQQPGLTAERFVPSPFGPLGATLYRTGDVARWRNNAIEFQGRRDHQLKIRGFRVELGEIESVLASHPDIKQCAVLAPSSQASENLQQLIACYSSRSSNQIPTVALRSYSKKRLPAYMVPTVYVSLESLPLTANGKVDRAGLSELALMSVRNDDQATIGNPAVTPTEEILVGIWQELFGSAATGIDDDFFDLGGHSLLATRLLGRVRQVFSIELPLRALFESPALADFAERIDAARGLDDAAAAPRWVAVPRERRPDGWSAPLSFAQQRLWFLDRMEIDSSLYNIPLALRLTGRLDTEVLSRSLDEIILRHEVLRTRFPAEAGEAIQLITDVLELPLAFDDLSMFSDSEQRDELARKIREEVWQAFDLAAGPLLRGRLIKLTEVEHALTLTLHHIVSDGWSMEILLRELIDLYEAFSMGQPSPLRPLTIQYADFVYWQRSWLQGSVLETQLEYWRQQLAGAPVLLQLPRDRPRPSVQSYRGSSLAFRWPREVEVAVRELAKAEDATLFMTLLAAFHILLARYSQQDDFCVGVAIANRGRRETEDLIGFFVNPLVMRVDSSNGPSFRNLLRRVRERALEAYTYQDLPFEQLVETLQPDRSLSHSPLFQVGFALHNAPVAVRQLTDLKIRQISTPTTTSKHDLILDLTETGSGFVGETEYAVDLFDATSIRRLQDHFRILLEQIIAAPEKTIRYLGLLSEPERQQLIRDNATAREYPRDLDLPSLFARIASSQPESIALAFGEGTVSYGELNRRANRLAGVLGRKGVRRGAPVGLFFDPSPDLLISILGILSAGGVYVPLAAEYPAERLRFVMDDAGVEVLVTRRALLEQLEATGLEVVCLDREPDLVKLSASTVSTGTGTTSTVSATTLADDLAYVIYTSGSTGAPKGVAVSHRAVSRLVLGTDYLQVRAGERVAQGANSSFDAATFEIWGALLNGGQLVGIPRQVLLSPSDLARDLERHRINHLFLTTALFNQVVNQMPGALSTIDTVLFGGEACDPEVVRRALRKPSAVRLLHVYGPTENTTFSTWFHVTELEHGAQTVRIGRPVANSTAYVMDRCFMPVPDGIDGELVLGGDGLAQGYLGRPSLTAERFVAHPFEPGQRLYRTGDMVRRRGAAQLEFLGRRDGQVKIRGYRIELGEIETTMTSHPGVRECVVIVNAVEQLTESSGHRQTGQRLVAYWTSDWDPAPSCENLERFLQEHLPEFMIPESFLKFAELPLTPNGKIDRGALPSLEDSRVELEASVTQPRNLTEEILAGIWAKVLAVDQVGIHDDFFELGGHSLLATQTIARIRRVLVVDPHLQDLFENSTVAEFAAWIEEGRSQQRDVIAPAISRIERDGDLQLSFAQQRLWFLDQLDPGNPFYNVPAALSLAPGINVMALEHSLTEILRRQEALRTCFPAVDGKASQVVNEPSGFLLPIFDLGWLAPEVLGRELERLRLAEARRPFDLSAGPLFRAQLVRGRKARDRDVLLITMHHIVSDGWSLDILYRELSVLYAAFVSRQPSPLPALTIQYADFAAWQRQWLSGRVQAKQLEYWCRVLEGAPALLRLPTDRPRPDAQSHRGRVESCLWPLSVLHAMQDLGRQHDTTLFMTILAAFQTLLSRYSGQEDVCVGTPVANRGRAELESLIGFFVNTFVLRLDLTGEPNFATALDRVREAALGAFSHQDLPFEQVVEALQPDRSLSHSPLFQVMFAVRNADNEEPELRGLDLRPLDDVRTETSKFDLILVATECREGLRLSLEIDLDLFDPSTSRRLLQHLRALIDQATADPQRGIADLDLLSASERHLLLAEWNDSAPIDPWRSSLCDLFSQQAERSRAAVAAAYDGQLLSYGELDRRSDLLAQHLRHLGVRSDDVVGLFVDRSPEMVVGMLGILKAGGAYLPLDLAYPDQRLRTMLEDAKVRVLLTRRALHHRLSESVGEAVFLDEEWGSSGVTGTSPLLQVSPAHLAYVIYTSGSTGVPKGVAVCQRAVARLVTRTNYVSLGESARIAQASSSSFDAATFEIWGALLSGGQLVGIAEDVLLSPDALASKLQRERVTHLFLTTALFNQVARECPDALAKMDTVLFGGEEVDPSAVRRVLARHPPGRLLHVYGPTENTTFSSWNRVRSVPAEAPTVAIGVPLAASTVHILDTLLKPVPIGVCGDLYLGGTGLARGYLRRPGKTAECFIPAPFGGVGSRLYRTGDSAAYRPDSNVEFIGRKDRQVKIRGFRIELGEVEVALGRLAGVSECVVLARRDASPGGSKQLIAYLVAETVLTPVELREGLRSTLPEFMLPAHIVMLDSLPLNANGKVDRESLRALALPVDESEVEDARAALTAPRTEVEQIVTGVWMETLNTNRVGLDDDFFDLGGHSLMATQVVSRLREVFQVDLPLRALFENPTPKALAARLTTAQQANTGGGRKPLEALGVRGAVRLSHAQERLWFLDRALPGCAYNVPLYLRLQGELEIAALQASLAAIWQRHEVVRSRFPQRDGRPVQVVTEETGILPCVDLRRVLGSRRRAEAARLSLEQSARSFDLANGPAWRQFLLLISDDEFHLLLVFHHIVFDGASIPVLLRELTALYAAASTNSPSPLETPRLQYSDFAHWQRAWLEELGDEAMTWWREQLGVGTPVVEVPTDRPRSLTPSQHGADRSCILRDDVSSGLRKIGRQRHATLFMTTLAAFKVMLRRTTGSRRGVVGFPVSNRDRPELEPLLGFFVNTLVVKSELADAMSFLDFLEAVRDSALGAMAHGEIPFERVVQKLAPERSAISPSLFQVMFTFQVGQGAAPAFELGGMQAQLLPAETSGAKFDLTLGVEETSSGALAATFEYNTDLFDGTTIERLVRHFQNLVCALVDSPERAVSDLSMLSRAESHQVAIEWNASTFLPPAVVRVHRLFEDRCETQADALAVVSGDHHLSYGELNRQANGLAYRLEALGVGPEELVAVALRQSVERVVALLAVLKTGAAYISLDPDDPPARLTEPLELLAPRAVLTESGRCGLATHCEVAILSPHRERANRRFANPQPLLHGATLAYVIFTSGSTGKPKAVGVSHDALNNLCEWHRRTFVVGPGDRAMLLASPAFDASVWELWPYFISGASLWISDPASRLSPLDLSPRMAEQRVTLAFMATPFAEIALAHEWPKDMSLRLLLTGGDRLRQFPGDGISCKLINNYGPTESAVVATSVQVPPRGQDRRSSTAGPPAIGRPIRNTHIQLMSSDLVEVARGAHGEIAISGLGLARGYLGQPRRTAEAFVPDTTTQTTGGRTYLTGDRARTRYDGQIEFLGRLDQQVKIRGRRIELAEIETALRELRFESTAKVRDAVVVANDDQDREPLLIAYVVFYPGATVANSELRRRLSEILPAAMLPGAWFVLDALPVTSRGKLDRRALPVPETRHTNHEQVDLGAGPARSGHELERTLTEIWCRVLGLETVSWDDHFFEIGGSSLLAVEVQSRLRDRLERQVPVVKLFEYPTIRALARFLDEPQASTVSRIHPRKEPIDESAIAIVGMAGRFPGARNPEQLWQRLRDGVELVSRFDEQELARAGVDPATMVDADYVPAGGVLEDIDLFDAAFFEFSPREAETMDPQQRIFLECAWEALENAACDPATYPGAIGVFAGAAMSSYLENAGSAAGLQGHLGNAPGFLTTRVSYKLNLSGPSLDVQTACSTSLVAVALACQSLTDRRSDVALAGGVAIKVPQGVGYHYEKHGIFSPDGHCRAFDAKAEGTLPANGAGIVVLKRLRDALRDGDSIRAVIRGAALNNDGSAKVGYTAPSVAGQARVIADAVARAGIEPETLGYIEAHGTGTAVGDPIEVAALNQVLGAGVAPGPCAIGSLKSNLGHLDTAAGVAGLIKTVLALEHRQIPPSLHFENPNPRIDFSSGPLYVNTSLEDWTPSEAAPEGAPLRAGVSSFGIGGTNAHVIVEQAPEPMPADDGRPVQLAVLSAKTPAALMAIRRNLAAHLTEHPNLPLADVAFTLQVGRTALRPHRAMAVVASTDEAHRALSESSPADGGVEHRTVLDGERSVAFLFPGQGSQVPGMSPAIYRSEPVFRQRVDECCELLRPILGVDLRELMFPAIEPDAEDERLQEAWLVQPALFVIEISLAALWRSWGIVPRALLGHSLGEYAAAYVAGVLSLGDALRLVAARGRLMQDLQPGAMLAVAQPPEQLRERLPADLSVAAVNSPRQTVVSGAEASISELQTELITRGVRCRRLATRHAFHSVMVESILAAFEREVTAVQLTTPRIPFLSNLTGTWIRDDQATDPRYWVQQMRHTVLFSSALETLLEEPDRVLLEVGPGQALTALARQQAPAGSTPPRVFPSLPRPQNQAQWQDTTQRRDGGEDLKCLLTSLGRLWMTGVSVDWVGFNAEQKRRRCVLPTYPFERQRYWLEPTSLASNRIGVSDATAEHAALYSTPVWRQAGLARAGVLPPRDSEWLVFVDELGVGTALVEDLTRQQSSVTTVMAGERFSRISSRAFSIHPGRAEDYRRLLADLTLAPGTRLEVVHLWSLAERDRSPAIDLERGLFGLILLVESLEAEAKGRIQVVASHQHELIGELDPLPARAALTGACEAITEQNPGLVCRAIDVEPPRVGGVWDNAHNLRLVKELLGTVNDSPVAYRGHRRWHRVLEPVEASAVKESPSPLAPEAVCLVVGDSPRLITALARDRRRAGRASIGVVGPQEPAEDLMSPLGDSLDFEALSEVLTSTQQRLSAGQSLKNPRGLAMASDPVCASFIHEVFLAQGLGEEDSPYTREEIRDRLGLQPKFERFLDFFLEVLVDDQRCDIKDGKFNVRNVGARTSKAARQAVESQMPQLVDLHDFLEHCARGYGGALRGDTEPLGLIYPEGDVDALSRATRGLEEVSRLDLCIDLLAKAVVSVVEQSSTRTVRLLEVGAGQGIVLDRLSASLGDKELDYHFTDISRPLLARARLRMTQENLSFVTGRLDISRDPLSQGYAADSFDIVVALNVVHATPEIRQTLDHINQLLIPGGLLLLVETVRQERWMQMIWGLAEGWWQFTDNDLRQAGPLLGIERWQEVLRERGFGPIGTWQGEVGATETDAALFMAQRPLTGQGRATVYQSVELTDSEATRSALATVREQLGDPRSVFLALDPVGSEQPEEYFRDFERSLSCVSELGSILAAGSPDVVGYLSLDHADDRRGQILQRAWKECLRALAAPQSHDGGAGVSQGVSVHCRTLDHESVAGRAPFGRALEAILSDRVETAEVGASRAASQQNDAPEPPKADPPNPALYPRPELQSSYLAPSTQLEQQIVDIWRRVLGVAQIGVRDNFFELGGDSLAGLSVARMIREELSVELGETVLFENPTVADLTRFMASSPESGDSEDDSFDRARRKGERRRKRLSRRRRR